ncbi:aldehyde dehydrogenase [Fomitiporia mediterranea MF3/22]|uniref:aldehyde dehydrogenase n=1 Tax=Fomitiporia mediterranea (strain MF3/22) TaxID=694068 RepID=UPI0004407DB4|nr:aldehyde dehydrogenase [Fomitiporia mediterranea MF3/22]EJD01954.1 aldehyde dehydrogenase [Fomitiporia mediterranea MF3/22]
MPQTFTHAFDTPVFKGKVSFSTGLFINGKSVDSVDGETWDVINPTTGKATTTIAMGNSKDVDVAVKVAREAYETRWGLNVPGYERGKLLMKLADLMDEVHDELAALEALDNGKTFSWAKNADVPGAIQTIRYFGGWADKNQGKVIETDESKLAYTRHEPLGVVGQIIPWNFPLLMLSWKIAPALATGNAIVLKPSEFTPLSALRLVDLFQKAGFPPGVINIVNGFGNTAGVAISEHPGIDKVAFTGSTLVGRKIMEAAARTNLKNVTLELGGKSPNIIFDDADVDQAVSWAIHGVFWNHGQCCCAGTRVFVQQGIYDNFLQKFTAKAQALKIGDPFGKETYQGPQISQVQYDRIMGYIDSGKKDGATLHLGGSRIGDEGYFIEPTIFTDTRPDMKIVREEIFGPVGVVIKFASEDDVIKQANDTHYGLAASVFTKNIDRALRVTHRLQAGTAWINCTNLTNAQIPFGGYKQSGIGRENGEYALANYTAVKAIHVNIGMTI